MKIREVSALVVDSNTEGVDEFVRSLGPEVKFASVDVTASLRKAVLSHSEEEFQICFVSDRFPEQDTFSFFKDVRSIQHAAACIFVQVREEIPEDLGADALKAGGFSTAVSRRGTFKDKENLLKALEDCFYAREVKKRKLDVETGMSKLLAEIDRAAIDIRRGVPRKLAAIRMDGIELDVQFDPEVLESYFETLEKQTEAAAPRVIEKLKIPEKVLQRALPGLSAEGYKGASHRVWKMLASRYGVKAGEDPGPPASASGDRVADSKASEGAVANGAQKSEPPKAAQK